MIGGAALIVTKWSLLAGTPEAARIGLLLVFPCLARFGMLATMAVFPYARNQGLGSSLLEDARSWQIGVGLVTAALAAGLFLGLGGLVLFSAVTLVALGLGRWMTSKLGGMTGDAYGAVNEVGEISVLILGIALVPVLPELFNAPFW